MERLPRMAQLGDGSGHLSPSARPMMTGMSGSDGNDPAHLGVLVGRRIVKGWDRNGQVVPVAIADVFLEGIIVFVREADRCLALIIIIIIV